MEKVGNIIALKQRTFGCTCHIKATQAKNFHIFSYKNRSLLQPAFQRYLMTCQKVKKSKKNGLSAHSDKD
jgi:hypothetical protein